MKKLEFYEPAMCCSTGLCGPNIDERLVRLNENIQFLKGKYTDVEINRYMISQQPLKFRDNQSVYALIKEKGKNILPVTTWKGQIVKSGDYPELNELVALITEGGL